MTLVVQEKLVLKQFDVRTAFLHGDLDEVVYMKQPKGFSDGTNRVCRLYKSLYGLHQLSRCWNIMIRSFMLSYGFAQSKADPCVYFKKLDDQIQLVACLYIDDGLVAGLDEEYVNEFLSALEKKFDITHGEPDVYLGLQIKRNQDGSIFLHQQAYARKILEKYNMKKAGTLCVPADPNQELCIDFHTGDQTKPTKAPYREAIGFLIYLSKGTRPDIAFSVRLASRFWKIPLNYTGMQ